jgi:5-methyltetrahydrofolate--homocysteine methyltransferase
MIGLSGPNAALEEMAHVAKEMERWGFKLPLLIGGATTSRTHTAVKIEPNYSGPTVWVPDASRAVGVASQLSSDELRPKYVGEVRADYVKVREQHARKTGQKSVKLEAARANSVKLDWISYAPPAPKQLGLTSLKNYPLEKLVPFIDWAPFFQTWDLAGKYPEILKDPVVGEAARNVLAEGKAMLDRVVKGRWLTASAVYGLWPANSVGDDIEIYADEKREARADDVAQPAPAGREPSGSPNQCLSDFVAPRVRPCAIISALSPLPRHRHRRAREGIRGEERRLRRHHAEGDRRSPRRSVRRAPALSRAYRSSGASPGRRSSPAAS